MGICVGIVTGEDRRDCRSRSLDGLGVVRARRVNSHLGRRLRFLMSSRAESLDERRKVAAAAALEIRVWGWRD